MGKLPHEELMQEEGLSYSNLPDEIVQELQELDELKKEYNEYPSEKGWKILQTESVKLADTIQDFLEEELEESNEDDESSEGGKVNTSVNTPVANENKINTPTQNDSDSKPSWRFWM